MSLRTIALQPTYNSEDDSIVRDFYLPALGEAVTYSRAVGFFSAAMLVLAAQGLSRFLSNGGNIRLVIGDYLDDDEYEAVQKGENLVAVGERLTEKLIDILSQAKSDRVLCRLELLSWLVATRRMEIKFALRRNGMYHEKIGVLTDADGNRVVFQGSANETNNALLPSRNFESISVYSSWDTEIFSRYGNTYEKRFEDLWAGRIKSIKTIDVRSSFYEQLSKFRSSTLPPNPDFETYIANNIECGFDVEPSTAEPEYPLYLGNHKYSLLEHQKNAILEWQRNSYQGIFALATGAGKTITSIHAAVATYKGFKNQSLLVVIAVPYVPLADQWCDVLSMYSIHPVRCYISRNDWEMQLQNIVSNISLPGMTRHLSCIVVVNATLTGQTFHDLISKVPRHLLFFIGDECHHHSSNLIARKLPDAKYRIGLSATPWNPGAHESRLALEAYYGKIVAKYSIDDAIAQDVLCPYEYLPHFVRLDDEEWSEYQSLSVEIANLMTKRGNGERVDQTRLDHAIWSRQRILGSASEKFVVLDELLRQRKPTPLTLFYCGDGSTEVSGEAPIRAVEAIVRQTKKYGWKSRRFTADESANDRRAILESFEECFIDALVSIRVLDEGIDIPGCREAFILASNRSERQYVQRRGRILRKSAGKSMAYIHDFIVLPPRGIHNETAKSLVTNEAKRYYEFSRVASNAAQLNETLQNLKSQYSIENVLESSDHAEE